MEDRRVRASESDNVCLSDERCVGKPQKCRRAMTVEQSNLVKPISGLIIDTEYTVICNYIVYRHKEAAAKNKIKTNPDDKEPCLLAFGLGQAKRGMVGKFHITCRTVRSNLS